MSHTPGPWIFHTSPNCWTVLQGGSSGSWYVAGGTGWGLPGKWREAEANARLIAAAPDLFQALLNLVGTMCAADGSDMESDPDAIDARVGDARAAIAKATGGAT